MAEKGLCVGCMNTMCGTISSLLVMAAGVVLLLSALGNLDGTTAMLVAGAALALYGLGELVHVLSLCPLCRH